jgi:OOP family OmpA-OmpF porin
MKKKFFILMVMILVLFLGISCTSYHFKVSDKAIGIPTEFNQTEIAIAQSEKSQGAKYCPDKIAKAKEIAKKGIETYWACRTDEAIKLLADARQMAKEAEGCQPPPPPPPPPPTPSPPAPPTPPPPPPPLPPCPPPFPMVMVIEKMTLRVFFEFDKSILTEADLKELPKAVVFVKKYPGAKIKLDGYTDNVGTEEYNLKLSERRAEAVMDYLIKEAGVFSSKITAVGHGMADPIADNKTSEGRAKNRRVEISILSDPQPSPQPPSSPLSPCPPPFPKAIEKPSSKVIEKMTLRVFFEFDKSILTEADLKELPKAVAFVKKYPSAMIRLDGYSDSIGIEEYNLKLSERRAEAVMDYLIKEAGVSSSKIMAVGHGEADPIADNKTSEGRAKNRRVEISILSD